jgi:hypothetical protein
MTEKILLKNSFLCKKFEKSEIFSFNKNINNEILRNRGNSIFIFNH